LHKKGASQGCLPSRQCLCQTGEIFIGTDNRNRFGKILFATYADDLTFMVKERIGVNEKKRKIGPTRK
jgi:excinuclease UvrABC helicase subunit UvrB